MFDYLLVGLGGAIGSMARYGLGQMIAARHGEAFPVATLVINVTGSFLIGLFAAFSLDANSSTMRLFLMVGVCGGYTTFSSFSLQSLNLIREGHVAAAGLNAALSVALCLIAVAAGQFAGLAIHRARA